MRGSTSGSTSWCGSLVLVALRAAMADAGVSTIEDLNNLPQEDGYAAYVYECDWLLVCDKRQHNGCGREFPGTVHYHVTSSR